MGAVSREWLLSNSKQVGAWIQCRGKFCGKRGGRWSTLLSCDHMNVPPATLPHAENALDLFLAATDNSPYLADKSKGNYRRYVNEIKRWMRGDFMPGEKNAQRARTRR